MSAAKSPIPATTSKVGPTLTVAIIFKHGDPVAGAECCICMEALSKENYVEYRAIPNGAWLSCDKYCETCVKESFIKRQWADYLHQFEKADCAAAVRRLLASTPLRVKDAGFPLCKDNGYNGEVQALWWGGSNTESDAKLVSAPEGAARQAFVEEKQQHARALEVAEAAAKAAESASVATNPTATATANSSNVSSAISAAVSVKSHH